MAKEQALAKQKEALKAKVTKKKTAPGVKKNLTLETDNLTQDKDDDFDRDGDSMSKEELEKGSSNSVDNLQRLEFDAGETEKDNMQKTLSSTQLQEMFKSSFEGTEGTEDDKK